MSRTLARETAFKALFQLDFNHGEIDEREIYEPLAIETAIESAVETAKKNDSLNEQNFIYINNTVRNVRARLAEIDEIIQSHLKKNWTLSRLASAD